MTKELLIVGNWKMNGTCDEASDLSSTIQHVGNFCDVVICPPFTAMSYVQDAGIKLGAQDCNQHQSGAYTGEISPSMLKDAGCDYVILGHSERRKYHNESSQLVAQKALAAHKADLITIICVGETLEQRDSAQTLAVLSEQLQQSINTSSDSNNTVIAYEPVWAIGTGKVATIEQIAEVHNHINQYIAQHFTLFNKPANPLYGGSVNSDNADEIMNIPSVGGVLVGGASLKAESFNLIIAVANRIVENV